MNGQQFSSSGVAYEYRPQPSVSSLSPSSGAAEGGTPVTVLGSGFSASAEAAGELLCRWNASVVRALYVSEHALVCNTSRGDEAGYVSLEVTSNGREFTSSGVAYELVRVSVSDVVPWSGPVGGATVVTIGGARLGGASYE